MFALDLPSTISFQMPDIYGGVKGIGGYVASQATQVYSHTKALIDPAMDFMLNPGSFFGEAYDGTKRIASAGVDMAGKAVDKVTNAVSGAAGSVSSGLKWAAFLVAIGAALWALSVLTPWIKGR